MTLMKMNKYYLPEARRKEEFYYLLNQPRSESILILPENKLNSKSDELEYYLSAYPTGVNLIIAPTGIGKTYWAREKILKGQHKSVLIIAPTKLIVEEITQDLTASNKLVVSDSLIDLGLVNLTSGELTVVVCTYHHAIKYQQYLAQVDLLIIDEAHWIHEYDFTEKESGQNIGWEMLQVIKELHEQTQIIMLTASATLLLAFPEWFFIRQIIWAKQPKKPVLPKKIYVYPSSGHISSLQYLRNSFPRLIKVTDSVNKTLIFQDGGMKRTAQFHNIENAVAQSLEKMGINANVMNSCKSQDKADNKTIQSILNTNKLDEDTQVFITTSFAATGINIKDENVKNILVLSDRITFIQQASARLRAHKQANLILFQQPNSNSSETTCPSQGQVTEAMKHKIETGETLKGIDIMFTGRWVENAKGELDFNPINSLQRWINNQERGICANLYSFIGMLELIFESVEPPEIEIINKDFIGCTLDEDTIKLLKELTGYEEMKNDKSQSIPIETIKKELNIQTKEVQLYTKRQIEKILAEQNREFMIGITVNTKRDKNRNVKYYLI